ncbi:MAG: hypothetical protein IIC96_03895 [Chloroflexi bacterium]|nr:hypothetical protein [Chloroflexota bacterium]
MSKAWGGVLVVTGFIACPCHLIITLPIVIGLMAGTGAGAILAANTGLVYGIAGGYFVVALAAGWYLLNRKRSKAGPARAGSVASEGRHLPT